MTPGLFPFWKEMIVEVFCLLSSSSSQWVNAAGALRRTWKEKDWPGHGSQTGWPKRQKMSGQEEMAGSQKETGAGTAGKF